MTRATFSFAVLLLALAGSLVDAQHPPISAQDIAIYFSPKGGAADAVIKELNAAKAEIKVQAYSFTHAGIAQALHKAQERGVKVSVVLDDSNERDQYTVATYLTNHKVPVKIDHRHAIAHNKVMIIDRQTVVTGSFNFTKAADESNAENLLIIKRADIATKFLTNFDEHEGHAREYRGR